MQEDSQCAIFLKADPFMKKDLDLIRSVQKVYKHVSIILDRKWQRDDYLLTFSERSEIINHDLREAKITNYSIIPNDTTKYDTVNSRGIKNLVIKIDQFSSLDAIQDDCILDAEMVPGANIIMIPNFSNVRTPKRNLLYNILLEDTTHKIYKRYISDFAYIKTKFKLMPKIGLTGSIGCKIDVIQRAFKDCGYEVIDAGQMVINIVHDRSAVSKIFQQLERAGIDTTRITRTKNGLLDIVEDAAIQLYSNNQSARSIFLKHLQDEVKYRILKRVMSTTKKTLLISSTLLFEMKMDQMFNIIISANAATSTMKSNMKQFSTLTPSQISNYSKLFIPIADKVSRSDYFIDVNCSDEEIKKNTSMLIAKKLEKFY